MLCALTTHTFTHPPQRRWALYDYGLEAVRAWDASYKHPYPGEPGQAADTSVD